MIAERPRKYDKTFEEIRRALPQLLEQLQNPARRFKLKEYLGHGKGKQTAYTTLSDVGIISSQDTPLKFAGIYLLYYQEKPFYVGISRNVLSRLKQHVSGGSHYAASLAYKIAKENMAGFQGQRKDMSLDQIKEAQAYLLEHCESSILPVDNAEQLYLLELYAAMKLKTPYNTFETH